MSGAGPDPPAQTLYALLGVREDAEASGIKRAYRQRALVVHPDKQSQVVAVAAAAVAGGRGGADASAAFVALRRAYETLRHAPLRLAYDRELAVARGDAAAPSLVCDDVDINDLRFVEVQSGDEDDDDVGVGENDDDDDDDDDDRDTYEHTCRCGGVVVVPATALEAGITRYACGGCSLAIRVVGTDAD